MNKQKLLRFVDKFHLNGKISQAILTSKNNVLSTRFLSADKLVLGDVSMSNWKFEDATMAIYDTGRLYKILSILDDEIDMKQLDVGGKSAYLQFSDGNSRAQFMLSDPSIIRKSPATKDLPDFTLQLKIDKDFINKFVAGRGALPDTDTFTITTDNGIVKLVIGYSTIASNRLSIKTEVLQFDDLKKTISFDVDLMKEILSANKDCENAVLEVSEKGLIRTSFKVDDYEATYYLVAVQDAD